MRFHPSFLLFCAGAGLFLGACMTQDPSLLKIRAKDLLQSAKKVDAKDWRTLRAEESLRQGELQMLHSDYNHARYFFKESIRDSSDVVEETYLPDDKVVKLVTAKNTTDKNESENLVPPPKSAPIPPPAPAIAPPPPPPPKRMPVKRESIFKGRLPFTQNKDDSFVREDLDKAIKIMLDDPKAILYMNGEIGESEHEPISGERFKVVSNILMREGVERERIRIDDKISRQEYPQVYLEIRSEPKEQYRSP